MGTHELYRIARAVAEEFGDDELEKLIASGGFRGVDCELKNLIFAAVGAKPRIVLRDAIEKTSSRSSKEQDRGLVYDRPLMPTGLTWADLLGWWREGRPSEDDCAVAIRAVPSALAFPGEPTREAALRDVLQALQR